MKTKLLAILLLMIFSLSGFGQITPSHDNTWVLNTSLSDEFNGDVIDQAKWCVCGNPGCPCVAWGMTPNSDQSNTNFQNTNTFLEYDTDFDNNVLSLRVDAPIGNPNPHYLFQQCCHTGGILSVNESYSYGFFEISVRMPGCDANGVGHARKLWPALWTYHVEETPTYIHDEIDIFDPGGEYYSDARSYHGQVVDLDVNNNGYCPYQYFNQSADELCLEYHKFSAEWNSDRIYFYFDDVIVGNFRNHPSLVMDPMRLVLDLQLDGSVYEFDPDLPFPQFMRIDYFRYYQLAQSCSTDKLLTTAIQFGKFFNNPAVCRNITVGNGTNTISVTAGTTRTLRATNEVTIFGDFTVPLNAEFNIIPTPCN